MNASKQQGKGAKEGKDQPATQEKDFPTEFPEQKQEHRPGHRGPMHPKPVDDDPEYRAAGKLAGQVALITGGDSGIGRAVAIAFAKEGADVAIGYLDEEDDARSAAAAIEKLGRRVALLRGDVADQDAAQELVNQAIAQLGRLDILVNNAAEQHPQESIEDISADQLQRTFATNVFAMFYLVKAALPELKKRAGRIINTASVTAYRGSPSLLDYSATKGAIVAFTRSLSQNLIGDGVRVNAVAPGPIWTPLIVSTFPPEKSAEFGQDTPMQRAGQPSELAGAFVYLASADSSYVTGQTLHVNGGEIING